MSIKRVFHCDGPDCTTHGAEDAARHWIVVSWGQKPLHFHTWECVMRYGMTVEPTEVVGER